MKIKAKGESDLDGSRDNDIILLHFVEAEAAANLEPPRLDNRVTNLDNPSEIIKQAQKELVFNNSSSKEDHHKGTEQKGKGRHY